MSELPPQVLDASGLQAVPGGSAGLQYSVITDGQEVFANSLP